MIKLFEPVAQSSLSFFQVKCKPDALAPPAHAYTIVHVSPAFIDLTK